MIRSFLTVCAATFLIAGCVAPAATPTPSTVSPSSTASAAPTSAATAAPSASALTDWRLVTIPSAVAGRLATPVAVAAGPDRLVAVGGPVRAEGAFEGPLYGTIWTSTDGLTWTSIALGSDLDVGTGRSMSGPEPGFVDITYGRSGYVVLGYAMTDQGIRVGIWRSTTGEAWERVHLPETVLEGGRPVAVTAGGPGYVIVGTWVDATAPAKDAALPRAAVWTSPDGSAWSRVQDQNGFGVGGYIDTGESPDAGGMLDVTATQDGLVAVGQTCKAVNLMEKPLGRGSACRPLVWTSPDAMTWTRIDADVAVHPGSVSSIASMGERLVAVGGGWPMSPARYTLRSSDGATWRWAEEARVTGFEGVVGVPEAFLATSHEAGQIGLSTSPDGKTWTEIKGVPKMPAGPPIRDSDI